MRGLEQRIRELEQTVSALLRDVRRLPVRHASPLMPRQGCWLGKAAAAISKNSSGTVRIWSGEPGSEVDTGVDIADCYNRTADIASGAWVYVMFRHGYPYVEPADTTTSSSGIAWHNASGEQVPPHGVIWTAGDSLVSGTRYLEGYKPSSYFDSYYLVNNSDEWIAAGEYRTDGAWLMDASGPVAVDLSGSGGAVSAGQGWGPRPGSFYLHYRRLGFIAAGANYTAGGVSVAQFLQRQVEHAYGMFYTRLEQGQSCEFEVWLRDDSNLKGQPGGWDNITVYDGFMLNRDESIESGTMGHVILKGHQWELAGAACERNNTDNGYQSPGASMQQQFLPAPDVPQQLVQYSS